jgi:hypothetical protein
MVLVTLKKRSSDGTWSGEDYDSGRMVKGLKPTKKQTHGPEART